MRRHLQQRNPATTTAAIPSAPSPRRRETPSPAPSSVPAAAETSAAQPERRVHDHEPHGGYTEDHCEGNVRQAVYIGGGCGRRCQVADCYQYNQPIIPADKASVPRRFCKRGQRTSVLAGLLALRLHQSQSGGSGTDGRQYAARPMPRPRPHPCCSPPPPPPPPRPKVHMF